jgi:hypothetical protein
MFNIYSYKKRLIEINMELEELKNIYKYDSTMFCQWKIINLIKDKNLISKRLKEWII